LQDLLLIIWIIFENKKIGATIKKYEYEIRNTKPDQLLKIANALGISINIFMNFYIETVSNVLSLLFKLDD